MRLRVRTTGFTLAEMLVAITIGAFIALVSIGSLRAITASSATMDDVITRAAEVRYATDLIRDDLSNMYVYGDTADQRFIATLQQTGEANTTYLIFYTLCRNKARLDQPESELYEISYFLQEDDDGKLQLMRQQWPNPDADMEAGGILAVVADNVQLFYCRFFDGEQWGDEWPEEMQKLPDLVEVNLVGEAPTKGGSPITESFTINLVHSKGTTEDQDTGESAMGSIEAAQSATADSGG